MPHQLESEGRYFRNPMVPYQDYKRIIYEPGRIARIKMNRPRYLNAQSHAMFGELEDAYDRASQDPECHVIVTSGEGRCWSAGDDVNGLTPEGAPCLVTDETPDELIERFGSEREVWHQYNIEHDYYVSWWLHQKLPFIPKPTIAMVHGYCIAGSYGHATGLDLIFASEETLFLGRSGADNMVWDVGRRKALELAYENRFMTAREALELGLVNRVFPDYETLEKETLAYAERVASEIPGVLRRTKKAFRQTLDFMGYSAAYNASFHPFAEEWRRRAADGHPERFEGRGMARTPVALYALTQKLLSEGREVPAYVREALERAVARDDRAVWQRALSREWREPGRVERAELAARAWDEQRAKEGTVDIKLRIRDLLESLKP